MKINIWQLACSLFWPYQRKAIDLCSGAILSEWNSIQEKQNDENSIRIIPFFTPALIRQSYLAKVKSCLRIDIGDLDIYPQYEAIPMMDISEDNSADFCYKAGHFCEKIDELLLADRQINSPEYDSSFPLYEEYCKEFMLQFAKAWCKKEGYNWYQG